MIIIIFIGVFLLMFLLKNKHFVKTDLNKNFGSEQVPVIKCGLDVAFMSPGDFILIKRI